MDLFLYFLAGMFAFNAIPHVVSGVIGNRHMTPFGKESTAIVNVLWGFSNVAVAAFLLSLTTEGLRPPQSSEAIIAYLVGGFALSLTAAWMFSNPNARMPWWKK